VVFGADVMGELGCKAEGLDQSIKCYRVN